MNQYNQYCSDCGQWTNNRGPFGELLCSQCWQTQDKEIEDYERRQPYND